MIKEALIIVDVQNDFCDRIPNGKEIIEQLNKIILFARKNDWLILASKDWHSDGDHCLKDTNGARFNLDLSIDENTIIITKDTYSVFGNENISLTKILNENNIKKVYIGGLTVDYCVKETAIDSVKNGFNTYIIWDASKGIFKKKSKNEIKNELKNNGVNLIYLKDIL